MYSLEIYSLLQRAALNRLGYATVSPLYFCMFVCMSVFLFAPVVLCLEELELILDAVTGVRGGELESLTGLRGCLRHTTTRT